MLYTATKYHNSIQVDLFEQPTQQLLATVVNVNIPVKPHCNTNVRLHLQCPFSAVYSFLRFKF